MEHTSQHFFTKKKLRTLLDAFESQEPGGKEFKGLVFTPGFDGDKNPCVFAFPLFASKGKMAGPEEDVLLIQNTKLSLAGCPYPPPCDTLKLMGEDCYGD